MLIRGRIFKNQDFIALKNNSRLGSKYLCEGFKLQSCGTTLSKSCLHTSQIMDYSTTKLLPLPLNIEDLASSEKLKFSPQRSRDINSSYISSSTSPFTDVKSDKNIPVDDRIACYDCSGTINLSSAMQSNVPFPFVSRGKPIHLNMPGGQWGQKAKYVSEDLQNVHHTNMTQSSPRSGTSFSLGSKTGAKNFYFSLHTGNLNAFTTPWSSYSYLNACQVRKFCSAKPKTDSTETVLEKKEKKAESLQLSHKEKFKIIVKDYGPVVVVFHVAISLLSLGCCYVVIASGVDLSYIIKTFGISEGATAAGTATGFVIAYAIHKTFAPARFAVTLTAAPFIVKKLRKMGILKTPATKPQ